MLKKQNWKATWFSDEYVFGNWEEAACFLSDRSANIRFFESHPEKLELLRDTFDKKLRPDLPFFFDLGGLWWVVKLAKTRKLANTHWEKGKLSVC